MTTQAEKTLDEWPIPPREKHATIFAAFDAPRVVLGRGVDRTPSCRYDTLLAEQWKAQGFNITQKKAPLPEAGAGRNRIKSEKDILTWDVSEAS